jgi:hypothetical protein
MQQMKNYRILSTLYVIVFTLLIVHEIDSAFWKEWEMFNLPGGIQLFNLIHIIILPVFIIGYGILIKNGKKGLIFSFMLGSLGILAFVIHSVFLSIGYNQFKIPISIAIIILLGIISPYLLVIVYQIHKNLKGDRA